MAPKLFLLLLLGLARCVYAESNPDESLAKIRQLFVCQYFYDAGARSTDKDLRVKSTELAKQFEFRAMVLSSAVGGGASLMVESHNEYTSFISSLRALEGSERSKRLDTFNTSCLSLLNSRIDVKPPDRAPQLTESLFSCSYFYASFGRQTENQSDREALATSSEDFLQKARAFATKLNDESLASSLSQKGEQKSESFIAGLNGISKREKEARIKKFTSGCRIADRRAKAE